MTKSLYEKKDVIKKLNNDSKWKINFENQS